MPNGNKRVLSSASAGKSISKKLKTKLARDSSTDNGEKSEYFTTILEEENKTGDVEDLGNKVSSWRPANWETTLDKIREMRKNKDAPVDSMGCDKCVDQDSKPEVARFQALVSLMLSSQTKDEVTFAAMERLKNYKNGLNIASILEMSEETLGKLIYPVGFWKKKSKYLKETAVILKDKFHGDIPNTVELLCTLPGVGQKMAHLCMKTAWNITSGIGKNIFRFKELFKFFGIFWCLYVKFLYLLLKIIGVDTHVHRISNRIGWVKIPTKTPEQTRVALESWIPKSLWKEINHLLVGFGQQTCKPVRPLCNTCTNQPLCPYAKSKKPIKKLKTTKQ